MTRLINFDKRMVAPVITIVILAKIGDKFFSRNNFYRKYGLEVMCGIAAIVAIFVYNWMTWLNHISLHFFFYRTLKSRIISLLK